MQRQIALAAVLLASACAAFEPAPKDEPFVIYNHGNFTPEEVRRIRGQLDVGARALEKYLGPPDARKFPVAVSLRSGFGISHSNLGRGPIELYRVREMRAPTVHELTHVLAGYTSSRGHWTQEGFASYMQDQYGDESAFPTYKMAHELVKVLREEGSLLPMREVMADRNRQQYFNVRAPWQRWVAYTQSTSFCTYLIQTHGRERFLRLYDTALETIDFKGLYDKTAETLVDEWLSYVTGLPGDTEKARVLMRGMKTSLARE